MPEQDPKQTAGTSASDDGDAADRAQTAGTTEDEDRDAGEGKPKTDTETLNMLWKEKAERVNSLEAKIKELEERIESGDQPAADDDDETQTEIEAIEADNRELERLAPVDVAARATLRNNRALLRRVEALQQATVDAFTLQSVPEDKRESTHAFYLKNRRHFKDMSEAVRYLKNQDTTAENKALKVRIAELEKNGGGGERDRDREDTVRTAGRDHSTTSHAKARTVTKEQFDERQRQLRDAGDHTTAQEEQMKLRRGETILKG